MPLATACYTTKVLARDRTSLFRGFQLQTCCRHPNLLSSQSSPSSRKVLLIMSAAVQSPLVDLEREHIETLCALTLTPEPADAAIRYVERLYGEQSDAFVSLADSNHVIVRALTPVLARSRDAETHTW